MSLRPDLRKVLSSSGPERTAAFSDAVIAIAMTLLVLDIKAPEVGSRAEYDAALLDAVPQLGAFLLSFYLMSRMWGSHHAYLSALTHIDRDLLRWNCVMLFFMALTPLPTSMLAKNAYGSPVPGIFYALVISGTQMCMMALWRHAWTAGLMVSDITPQFGIAAGDLLDLSTPHRRLRAVGDAVLAPCACCQRRHQAPGRQAGETQRPSARRYVTL